MFARALKSNVIITMAVLLLIGMILINFVVVRTFQRLIIQKEAQKGSLLVSVLENELTRLDSPAQFPLSHELRKRALPILEAFAMPCALMVSADDPSSLSFGGTCEHEELLEDATSNALKSNQIQTTYKGSVWGVFWWQRQYFILSAPLKMKGETIGAIAVVRNLEAVYHDLRKSQKFIFVYLFINIVILTFIGFHRLFKIFLEPIERLAKRAENYHENDVPFFPVRKQDNELHVLSKSLNSMTRRITEDKKKLQEAVTSLEKSNIELKKAQEEIIRAEKLASVGRLSSGIAHEIGNPIGIIMGYLELLKQDTIQAQEKEEYIHRTEKEIHRMDTVIRQLLDLSRPSAGGTDAVSVHEIIHDIATVLNVQPLMSNIELTLSLEAESDQVTADPNQLRQVFLNLAINAADAISANSTTEAGRLEIKSFLNKAPSPDGGIDSKWMNIVFIDNGPGISQDILDNVFDPFFTTKEPGKGTGLGLYVCFMIIDAFGGSIQARNRDEGGAEMRITLPLAEEST